MAPPDTSPETGEAPRRTPLYECHRELGARMVGFAGWEMPVQYTGVIEEHRAVRSAAGLFDVSHMGEVRVRGAGAERFLQRLTPNDVAQLVPGRAHYSGLLTDRGTYVDDLLIYRLAADDFLVVVNASNAARDLAWIREHGPDRGSAEPADVEIADEGDRFALLALQGPQALAILEPLASPGIAGLRYYGFLRGEVAGVPAILSRTGYTGEDGFELYLEPQGAPEVWRRLLAAGAPHGLVPAGLGARDTLRLEAAMALYGHEIDERTTPLEAGLSWVVKLGKGDFLGRAALLEQSEQGVRRTLVGFTVEGRGIARQGHGVLSGGEAVGEVTSGTWSPTLEKAIGMAYVPPALAAPGTELELDVRGRKLPAAVVELPFYRRKKKSA
ncbi:MAG TPA: glycine cleavage system aminomethyltransferase GcvT [Thermoanaerobaculia bacterium]|nr:glycine cleavage system aminomethyltransferase GcvT [Thermoanaerobaculia bacterium]